jgi:hypothetical protein
MGAKQQSRIRLVSTLAAVAILSLGCGSESEQSIASPVKIEPTQETRVFCQYAAAADDLSRHRDRWTSSAPHPDPEDPAYEAAGLHGNELWALRLLLQLHAQQWDTARQGIEVGSHSPSDVAARESDFGRSHSETIVICRQIGAL